MKRIVSSGIALMALCAFTHFALADDDSVLVSGVLYVDHGATTICQKCPIAIPFGSVSLKNPQLESGEPVFPGEPERRLYVQPMLTDLNILGNKAGCVQLWDDCLIEGSHVSISGTMKTLEGGFKMITRIHFYGVETDQDEE
jgi:hypothetical protein